MSKPSRSNQSSDVSSDTLAVLQEFQSAIAAQAALTQAFGPAAPARDAMVSATVAATSSPTPQKTTSSTLTTATTTTTTTTTTLPSWISTLSTASIRTDMSAAIVNGAVTYSGLKTLLTNIGSALASTGTGLNSTQLADLKKIVSNLNVGVTTSAYLTNIMNALVNGSAANATWTGGAATSIALGNLAVGSTATQLSELIGKWVLGTDLPSSKVTMTGYNAFTVSYSPSSLPLFGASGPSMSDVNQGYLGDCYFLSTIAEVAYKNSSVINSMFTSNGNNTYGVRFYVNGVAQYVTVNNVLANGGSIFNHGPDLWASLAEKAYAQFQTITLDTGNSVNYGNSWSTIGNGGLPIYALEAVTGASELTNYYASGSSWTEINYNSSLASTSYNSGLSLSTLQSKLVARLQFGDDVILSSYTNAKDSTGKTTLVASHAMSIYGFNSVTGMFQVRNPWGTAAGQTWATTFEVSLSTLLAAGDTITIDNVGSKASAPVLNAQTASQSWIKGKAVSFTLAANTFVDPQGQALTYVATQANGAALPSWLTFNSATRTFTGTPPSTASSMQIKVMAIDPTGLSASETFLVGMSTPSAPLITSQTTNQAWAGGKPVSFTLALNTFTDPNGEALTLTATQSNGSALPSWLTFNGATRTFTGTTPTTASSLGIAVKATNLGGASTTETFSVSILAAVATLTQAISATPDTSGSGSLSFSPTTSNSGGSLATPLQNAA